MAKVANCDKNKPGLESRARVSERYTTAVPKRKLMMVPEDEISQNIMGDDLVIWSHDERSFDIEVFPLKLMLNPLKFFDVAQKNDYFKDCLIFARLMLYLRRAKRCDDRQYDNTWLIKTMPLYHALYEGFILEKRKQFDEVMAGKTQFKLCNCLNWPTSDIVKELPKDSERDS